MPGPNEPCWCGSGKKYKKCHQARDLLTRLGDVAKPKPAPPALRPVPLHIPRPEYADGGKPRSRGRTVPMTAEELPRMRAACAAARRVLDLACAAVRLGMTTDELDVLVHEACIREGGYPSPLNYHGFPKSVCTSINEVICHGIPDGTVLNDGDVVNIDVTIYLGGYHGDCNATVGVGTIDEESRRLIQVTRECLWAGIGQVKPGNRIHDIGRAIEAVAKPYGYGVVRAFVGHGIGPAFHQDPQVPHYYDPNARTLMVPGMTFTIEPMISAGTWQHITLDDGWTAITADRKRSTQFEHTLLVTDTGFEVLTLAPGETGP